MRICLVGSSHLAALKAAHDARPGAVAPHALRFFARPALIFRELSVSADGVHAPPHARRPQVRESVAFGDHDAIVVYGTLPLGPVLQAMFERKAGRFSPGYLDAGVTAILTDEPSIRLAAAIAQESGLPTHMLAAPLFARAPQFAPGGALAPSFLGEAMDRAADVFAGHGVSFIRQPAQTIKNNAYTRPRYGRGLEDQGILAKRENDVSHMNSTYGRIVLDAVIEAVTGEAPPAQQRRGLAGLLERR